MCLGRRQEFATVLGPDHRYPDRRIILQTSQQMTEFLDREHIILQTLQASLDSGRASSRPQGASASLLKWQLKPSMKQEEERRGSPPPSSRTCAFDWEDLAPLGPPRRGQVNVSNFTDSPFFQPQSQGVFRKTKLIFFGLMLSPYSNTND
jgi:hypothetical protein